jgi:hypothetical protein
VKISVIYFENDNAESQIIIETIDREHPSGPMATQKDVQDLLRMLTSGRNKITLMEAMRRIQVLQSAGMRSLSQIANGDLAALTKALGDEKAAKQLQTAAKKETHSDDKKRGASDSLTSPGSAKRSRCVYELANEPETQEAHEASLALPESKDEEEISRTTIICNRAPLVLAFAFALLKYTLPEQPPSSRLSLAQAVVSLNSQSKAASIGISSSATAEKEGWGHGQPKVRIMSREVPVLKRGGYEFRAPEHQEPREEAFHKTSKVGNESQVLESSANTTHITATGEQPFAVEDTPKWAVSEKVTSKGSTFVARSTAIKSSAHARQLLKELMARNPDIRDATHNVTAWRVHSEKGGNIEECEDDGETGGGHHVLSILKADNLVGVMLVLTRWYGGVMLGSQRWVLMTQVCRDSLSQRLRITGTVGKEALWGLDLEAMRSMNAPVAGGTAAGMPIHKPESARAYIMKAFASGEGTDGSPAKKKRTGVALEREKEHNLGLLLGALDLLFSSWVQHISRDDLDRRAWIWYTEVRPEVEAGVSGWGAKGPIRLAQVLNLRRKG